jgi:hypothetical protein
MGTAHFFHSILPFLGSKVSSYYIVSVIREGYESEGSVKIRLYYPAVMRIDTVKSGSTMEVHESASIEEVLKSCNVKEEHFRYILAFVNGEKKGMLHILRPNDELKLYLPIGGG